MPLPIESNQEYILMSRYYGMCGGESCVETFKLENSKIFEDSLDHYPMVSNKVYGFYNIGANNSIMSNLESLIPAILIND